MEEKTKEAIEKQNKINKIIIKKIKRLERSVLKTNKK